MTTWQVFPAEPAVLDWVEAVRPAAEASLSDPEMAIWHRHGGTWFAGVDALPNDATGAVPGGPALAGAALEASGPMPLHRGQVSVTYAGYPKRDPDESDAAHRFRLNRDAAHLDGLLPIGPERRRMIREPHAWILGLPLTEMRHDNAPLVVWEGSEEVMREALRAALAEHDPANWPDLDVTDIYQEARRTVFDACKRVEVTAKPGEAILVHRLSIHGVAPWTGPEGPARSVVYFRPLLPGGISDWLGLP